MTTITVEQLQALIASITFAILEDGGITNSAQEGCFNAIERGCGFGSAWVGSQGEWSEQSGLDGRPQYTPEAEKVFAVACRLAELQVQGRKLRRGSRIREAF